MEMFIFLPLCIMFVTADDQEGAPIPSKYIPNVDEMINLYSNMDELKNQIHNEMENLLRLMRESDALESRLSNGGHDSELKNDLAGGLNDLHIQEENLPPLGMYERFIVPSRILMKENIECMPGPSGMQSRSGQSSTFSLDIYQDKSKQREYMEQRMSAIRRKIINQKRDLTRLLQRLNQLQLNNLLNRADTGDLINFGGEDSDR